MAKFNASAHKLYIVEATVNKLVGELKSFDLDASADIINYTTKDNSGNRSIGVGLKSYSLNVDGLVDFQTDAAVRNFDDIMTAFKARTSLEILIKNTVTGDSTHAGTVFVTKCNLSSPMEDALAFSATFEFNGDLTVGAVA